MPDTDTPPLTCTLKETAHLLGLSYSTLTEHLRKGVFPLPVNRQIDGRRRFARADVLRLARGEWAMPVPGSSRRFFQRARREA